MQFYFNNEPLSDRISIWYFCCSMESDAIAIWDSKSSLSNIAVDGCNEEKVLSAYVFELIISLITLILFALHNYFKREYLTLILFLDLVQFVRHDTRHVRTRPTIRWPLFSPSDNLVVAQICWISNFDTLRRCNRKNERIKDERRSTATRG